MVRSVMIVDDEPVIKKYFHLILSDLGYEIFGIFETQGDALSAIETATPDAALLDVSLRHNATCLELADALTERRVPIVFVSGSPPGFRQSMQKYAEAPWLAKPVKPDDLGRVLGRLFEPCV